MSAESLDSPSNPLLNEEKKKKLRQLEATGKYASEDKLDGCRVGVGNINGQITLPNRRGIDYVKQRNTPEFVEVANLLPRDTFLDAEAISYCNPGQCPMKSRCLKQRVEHPCRLLIQKRLSTTTPHKWKPLKERIPIILRAFDLLKLKGKNVEALPFTERKALLKDLVAEVGHPALQYHPHQLKGFVKQFESQLEGTMLKILWSRYLHCRSGYWTKCKFTWRQICDVVGFTKSYEGRNKFFGWKSLVLFVDRRYVGKASIQGFNDVEKREVKEFLDKFQQAYPPMKLRVQVKDPFTHVLSGLKIEVAYQEESQYGIMYAPRKLKDGIIYPEGVQSQPQAQLTLT